MDLHSVTMPQMDPTILARLQAIAVAILFSTGGLVIKASTFSAWQVASFRCGVAALVLLLIAPAARRGWSWQTGLVGLPYAATVVLYTLGNKYTTAANTIFLQDTAPLYILLLAPFLLGERVARRDWWFLATLALGMLLFFARIDAPVPTAPRPLLGNLLAAASGVTWALTLLGVRWLARDDGQQGTPLAAVLAGNLIAFAAAGLFAWPVTDGGTANWLSVIYLGTFQIAAAYVLLAAAMRHLPALETSLVLLLEPVLNPIWVWLLLAEVPGRFAIMGGAIILLATMLRVLQENRRASLG